MAARKSPATRAKTARERKWGLTPEEAKEHEALKERRSSQIYNTIRNTRSKSPDTVMTPEAGVKFVADFAKLADAARGRNVVDLVQYRELVRAAGIPLDEVAALQHWLMFGDDSFVGKKLLFTMSASGYEEATIRICNHALLGSKARPQLLRSAEINFERGRLREMAGKGVNFRAMVLEGKIARALGQEDYALQLWEQAMSAAVAQSERDAAARALSPLLNDRVVVLFGSAARDLSELSSPWVDLTLLRFDRYARLSDEKKVSLALAEYERARQAMETGCRMDDPESHYHAAHFFRETTDDGSTIYTSSWLYHMTKAAASGQPMAAHQLTMFYAESGWKYIEDEPPDHLKPTPFDSYPAPKGSDAGNSGFLPTLRRFLGYDDDNSSASPSDPPSAAVRESDAMFHTAVFPETPNDRWALAFRWADVAIQNHYAPAYLYRAKMFLQEKLWAQAQMTEERYSDASKEAWEARMRQGQSTGTTTAAVPDEPVVGVVDDDEPPNRKYDPALARSYLTDVFYAAQAHKLRRRLIAEPLSRGRRRVSAATPADIEDIGSGNDERDDKYPPGTPWYVTMRLADPDVREMYEHEMDELTAEVMRICDERGWDLVDERGDGGLLFKARSGGKSM
ncbi:hypothetical protein B0A55_02872 [Friedmanniomyces simplex]|uniref:Uncharacterized protein n=1 Tax=Friedmanniomyces simplex TaxID=329884 RepID=A0A4V5NI14_9PEZI|nr:hypothetical protein B0A55_02872 [Friedmanniomyces simplex]